VKLNQLKPQKGSRKRKKRLGCGPGSGHGKTATMGMKGQTARSRSNKVGFEGGQMPLIIRTPKRGFNNPFKKEYAIVNLSSLEVFAEGTSIDIKLLKEKGLIAGKYIKYKLLGGGEVKKKLIIKTDYCSKKAEEKIKAASGEVIISA
jgi:large subunit ribosomal protein L15